MGIKELFSSLRPPELREGKNYGPKEAEKAGKFIDLVKDCLSYGITSEQYMEIQSKGGLYHNNRIEIGVTVVKKGVQRYFFEETVIEGGEIYREVYLANDNLVIFNRLLKGQELPRNGRSFVGKQVTDETLLVLEAKMQKIKNPFGGLSG